MVKIVKVIKVYTKLSITQLLNNLWKIYTLQQMVSSDNLTI